MERSVWNGLAVFRWVAWMWMATVLVLARRSLDRPGIAAGLVVAALAVTVWLTILGRRDHTALANPATVGIEVGVGLALQLADGFVYRAPHIFEAEQPLGVAWPIAGALAAGVAFGPVGGAATGVLLGLGRATSSLLSAPSVPPGDSAWVLGLTASWALSLVTTTVMLAMAGGVGGYVVDLLRRTEARATKAERRVAQASAREEVARQLHDGVLQTLAVVERRTDDPQLARLAREQEQDLRSYLFDVPDTPVVGAGALGDALRHVARRCETTHGLRTDVLVPDDLPDVSSRVIAVLKGAVGEAMTNAAKHAEAARVVVYVEPLDGGIFCSVRDDGTGFDVVATPEGVGLSRSIRGRIEQAGGTVQLDSAPGRGTEVRLTVPLDGTERSDA